MPKLPADLPENWTQGQTISPNGTEVGLTEKHGYNYLMKQVNDTQTEVNDINTALTDVAQQATVNEINNKIGEESDADTQPTLFGRLAQLKNVLLEKLAELLTKVTGIDGKIGSTDDTGGSNSSGSVNAKLNVLINNFQGGIKEFTNSGTFEFTVPDGIYNILVTASGAGAGAGESVKIKTPSMTYFHQGGAGGSGDCIVDKSYAVTPGQVIRIQVGKGGKTPPTQILNAASTGSTKGEDGQATVVGDLVTLPGGYGGEGGVKTATQKVYAAGGLKGGSNGQDGEKGGYTYKGTPYPMGGTILQANGGTNQTGYGNGGRPTWTNDYEPDSDIPNNNGVDGTSGYVCIKWGV